MPSCDPDGGGVGIGIGWGGNDGGGSAGTKGSTGNPGGIGNFPNGERLGLPTGYNAGVPFGPVLNDDPLELGAGKQLQHLAENAGYSYHRGGGPPFGSCLLNTNRSRVPPPLFKR